MSDINRVCLSGRLTRDGEYRRANGGMSVLEFGLAVGERRKNGERWEDYTNFVECAVFGKRAESLAEILKKGMQVFVEGRLRFSQWEKDGQRRSKLTVNVDELVLQPKGAQGAPSTAPTSAVYDEGLQSTVNAFFSGNPSAASPYPADTFATDEIPF